MDYFNLIDKPWIKVQTNDGDDLVSLHTLFDKADSLIKLCNESQYIDVAIYNILKAICQRSYNFDPNHRNDAKFIYNKEVILSYLKANKHLFNFYDPEHPFLQIPKDKIKSSSTARLYDYLKTLGKENTYDYRGPVSVRNFDIAVIGDNKPNAWSDDTSEIDSDDWIVRNFLAFRLYHPQIPGGGKFPMSMFGIPAPDLLGLTQIFYFGRNLKEFFELNCNRPNLYSEQDLRPDWEIDYSTKWEHNKAFFYDPEKDIKKDGNVKKTYEYRICSEEVKFDVTRFLTYSNTHFYIDRDTKKFYFSRGVPLKELLVEEEKEIQVKGDKTKVIKEKNLNPNLKVHTHTIYGTSNFSIAENVIERLTDRFNDKHVSYVEVVKVPVYDQKMASIKDYPEPLFLIGNSVLKAKDHSSNNADILGEYYDLIKYIEEKESRYIGWIQSILSDGRKPDAVKKLMEYSVSKLKLEVSKLLYNLCFKYKDEEVLQFGDLFDRFDASCSNIKNKVGSLYDDLFVNLVWQYAKSYFYKGLTNNKNTKEFIMNHFDKHTVSKNINSCIQKLRGSDDALVMQKLRRGQNVNIFCDNYEINNNSRYNTKYNEILNDGMNDALYLWANHQHSMQDDKNANAYYEADEEGNRNYKGNYKFSFGYILYTIYKQYSKDGNSWDNFIAKYERMDGRDIDRLKNFMKLSIDKALAINPNIQLDYGNLAYYFQRIRQNPDNMKDFARDNFLAFSMANSKSLCEDVQTNQNS